MVELLLSRAADPHAHDAALNSAELMGTSETAEQLRTLIGEAVAKN